MVHRVRVLRYKDLLVLRVLRVCLARMLDIKARARLSKDRQDRKDPQDI